MSRHEWRERTDDEEIRLVRVSRFGGRWRWEQRFKTEAGWTVLDPIPESDLLRLREVLDGKYRRGQVPFEHLAEIDRLLGRIP